MPNYGPSGRCLTCKRRRVKCDEAKPACSPCRRLGLECEGYSKRYTFRRDESHKFASAEKQGLSVQRPATTGEPSRSLLNKTDVAVPFFLVHYAGMGRGLAAARGFYETLIPMYTSQPHDSPLALAVSAVAARVLSLWRHEDDDTTAALVKSHSTPYTQAVASLRLALENPEDRRRPHTALAVLALHLYESVNAVFGARQATCVHHQGALSLLPVEALDGLYGDSLDGLISTYVKGFVLHIEISSALRQKRSMHPNARSYITNPHASFLVPGNFSSTLDSIGASIAELQADYVRRLSCRHALRDDPSLGQQCRAWVAEAAQIDGLLRAWARHVPAHWQPIRLASGQDFNPSITTYLSTCDIYPSCQISTLWNLWRFHRLLLQKITAGAIRISNLAPGGLAGDDEQLVQGRLENAIQARSVQELVDGICYSVPFYLGNRSRHLSFTDFTDSEILFPSYHLLVSGDTRIVAGYGRGLDAALSMDEHHRHMVAYGTWHILGPLSNLLTLFSDNHGGSLVSSCLRPGQQEWIREQFLRVSTSILHLPAAGSCGEPSDRTSSPFSSMNPSSADSAAESLAKQVRKGAQFMSGP